MDSRKLAVFLTVVRTGSFNRAAAEACCTQSAVTQMMNAFEAELGCRLLERSHAGVRLTAAGEKLLSSIVEADAALSRLGQRARMVAAGASVPVRIGTFSSISNSWLPRVLKDYARESPEVRFDIYVGTDAVADWLLAGTVDLALGDEDRLRAFRWTALMDDPYCAVLPADAPGAQGQVITQEALLAQPFLVAPMNALAQHIAGEPALPCIVNCDDDSTLLSMVSQGLGATAMPRLSLGRVPDGVRVLRLEPPTKRVVGVALPNSPRPEAEAFAAFLARYWRERGRKAHARTRPVAPSQGARSVQARCS